RKRSSAKRVAPVTFEVASTFLSARPTTRSSEGRRSVAVFLLVPIQALRRGARVLATHPRRRELHRFVDLDVAGAAAQVAREGVLDDVARGAGVGREQRLRRQQERWRAVAALGRAQLGERLLERM